jgi:hypothetical protein
VFDPTQFRFEPGSKPRFPLFSSEASKRADGISHFQVAFLPSIVGRSFALTGPTSLAGLRSEIVKRLHDVKCQSRNEFRDWPGII